MHSGSVVCVYPVSVGAAQIFNSAEEFNVWGVYTMAAPLAPFSVSGDQQEKIWVIRNLAAERR
ncbi:MAG: hypothetical protein U0996_21880 [Planctomycetaceae bacterium]